MKTIKKIKEMNKESGQLRSGKFTIGFVPTMGALHAGHISLVRKAKKTTDKVIVSIFVNPIQFGANEDFSKYPRPIKADMNILKREGADILFLPSANEMYRERITNISAEKYSSILCGMTRKNHFDGVLTVVAKLFNIVSPDFAFFGEKDYQQLTLVKRMASDLNFNVKIVQCPIVREKDKLAISSRNIYLSDKERREAPIIYNTLSFAKRLFKEGVKIDEIERISKKIIESDSSGRVDYIKIYEDKTLNEVTSKSRHCRIFAAVYFNRTRLIDNMGAER